MKELKLIESSNLLLKGTASEIEEITPEIFDLARDMVVTMAKRRGIGLAAPQVGQMVRLITVFVPGETPEPLVMINPEITYFNPKKDTMQEGCLSFPMLGVEVERPIGIVVEFTDLKGESQKLTLGGLTARCIQHEVDHLNGVTIRDHL